MVLAARALLRAPMAGEELGLRVLRPLLPGKLRERCIAIHVWRWAPHPKVRAERGPLGLGKRVVPVLFLEVPAALDAFSPLADGPLDGVADRSHHATLPLRGDALAVTEAGAEAAVLEENAATCLGLVHLGVWAFAAARRRPE